MLPTDPTSLDLSHMDATQLICWICDTVFIKNQLIASFCFPYEAGKSDLKKKSGTFSSNLYIAYLQFWLVIDRVRSQSLLVSPMKLCFSRSSVQIFIFYYDRLIFSASYTDNRHLGNLVFLFSMAMVPVQPFCSLLASIPPKLSWSCIRRRREPWRLFSAFVLPSLQ